MYRQLAIWAKASGASPKCNWTLFQFVRAFRTIPVVPVPLGRVIEANVIKWAVDVLVAASPPGFTSSFHDVPPHCLLAVQQLHAA